MLEPDYLIGGSTGLNLKHGLRVTGEWHILGILDCEPGAGDVDPTEMGQICGGVDNDFSNSVIELWYQFRQVIGRPEDCWGLTPLVIMREVI